jgi:hypothetical protein
MILLKKREKSQETEATNLQKPKYPSQRNNVKGQNPKKGI